MKNATSHPKALETFSPLSLLVSVVGSGVGSGPGPGRGGSWFGSTSVGSGGK